MSSRYEESILRSLRRITRAIDLHSRRLAQAYRLTAPQLVCLRAISVAGEMSPSDLAKTVSLSQPTITGIVDRLVERGLLERTRSDKDRRRVGLKLTKQGQDLVAVAPSPLQQRFAERLAHLEVESQGEVDRVLQQIVMMMEADELEASPILASGPLDEDVMI